MNGTYETMLPLPGGKRKCCMQLAQEGNSLTGYLTNPYTPEERCLIYDGSVHGDSLVWKAMVGRTEFVLEGTSEQDGLHLTLTTHETIPLEPGRRLTGKTGELAGEYLVGVYSPGGVKENHVCITGAPGNYGGEMFCLMDEKTLAFLKTHMPNMPGSAPTLPQLGDKMDVNPFLSVTGDAAAFEITTRTGSGSLFVFTGSVSGDAIAMTLHVTDVSDGLLAKKQL